MDLFGVLSKDERVIVLSSEEDGCIITWNRSLTLQWWILRQGKWHEADIRTLAEEPKNYESARMRAQACYVSEQ